MVNHLTEELEVTIQKLNTTSRRLMLLRGCIMDNKEFLNEHDLDVYRSIINCLYDDLDYLKIDSGTILDLLSKCTKVLNQAEHDLKIYNSCYITSDMEVAVNDDIVNRLDFQLRSLISVRGVKQFYVDSKTSLGELSERVLGTITNKVNINKYCDEHPKFMIKLNSDNILEFQEL